MTGLIRRLRDRATVYPTVRAITIAIVGTLPDNSPWCHAALILVEAEVDSGPSGHSAGLGMCC